MLIKHHGSKEAVPPVSFLYTDKGLEHRTNFVIVKIAIIALQKFLNLDQIVVARTAPGHSFRNPVEKVNCILNLGLYGIGCMHQQASDAEFEYEISKCDTLIQQQELIGKNPEVNRKLFSDTCMSCLKIIQNNFEQLILKENPFLCPDSPNNNYIEELFQSIQLDGNLAAHDGVQDLKDHPKLSQYLNHCGRERTYFLSIKKCGRKDCTTCLQPCLPENDFLRLKHLPDPMTSDYGKHYKPYDKVWGTVTNENHMLSLKTSKNMKHNILFNPLQQHALNTRLVIKCSKCDKPHVIYAQKKITAQESKDFKHVTDQLLYTCGSSLKEFKGHSNSTREHKLEKLLVKENHSCMKLVETIHFSCKIFPDCCIWYGSKQKLTTVPNTYLICSSCKNRKKSPF